MPNDDLRDLELLKAEISSRLRSACAHFPERDFEELVHQIAQIELKYAQRSTGLSPTLDP